MKFQIGSTIKIENPTAEMLTWATQNLSVCNPEYEMRTRLGLWTGNTPKTFALYERKGNVLELPFGILRDIPQAILAGNEFTTDFPDLPRLDFKADIPLYDYQQNAVDSMARGIYGILQAPAGCGKTQIGIALAAKIGKPTLWLCHTKDLIKQSYDRAAHYMPEDKLGYITNGQICIGECITFATIQTMCNVDLSKYKYYWDVIITDECHRVAGSPAAMTRYYKVLNSLSAPHKYGLSATVHRADGLIKSTYALIGNVIHRIDDQDVNGKIVPVGIVPVGTATKLSLDCLNGDGTLNYQMAIAYLTENRDRNNVIISTLEDKASLILSDRVTHLEVLKDMLPKCRQDQAVIINGTTKKKDRDKALDDMRNGTKLFLFATYSLAKEGLDIPGLERLYLATPKKDYAVVAQSIGRIARACPGKDQPIAYDFVDDFRSAARWYRERCTTYRKLGCFFP